MALFGATITKECDFHGQRERFDNTYYYEAGSAADLNTHNGLLNHLVAEEKKVHGNNVAFKQSRLWSAGGTPAQNVTLILRDESGNGALAGQAIAAEAAVMVEWETSRGSITGRKVYLRKFIRPQQLPAAFNAGQLQRSALVAADRAPFDSYADAVEATTPLPGTTLYTLTSRSGRVPKGVGNGISDPFLRTREFRRN